MVSQNLQKYRVLILSPVEEKVGNSLKRKRDYGDQHGIRSPDESTSDSESESEDEGDLATATLDSEIMATINAIRSKDPRVYDADAKFYASIDLEPSEDKTNKEKPMNLQDYHRRNLLNGTEAADDEEEDQTPPMTYNQEQEHLKRSIVKEIHAAAASGHQDQDLDQDLDNDDSFLVAKHRPKRKQKEPVLDVENADKDPDTYLSNFMVSRAWEQPVDRHLQPFESDDEDEERRAEEFEEAYNMRFEDPTKSNEKLQSHARDLAAKYSVRRTEENPRQKRRELEKSRKEAARDDLKADKARLRKLRIEEVEDKVRRIKKAAGLHSKKLKPEDWSHFVNDDWDDAQWEAEMQRRFGDQYYADNDVESDDAAESSSRRRPKKPKFDDEIDIQDIVPDFDNEEERTFSLSDDDLVEATEPEAQLATATRQKKTKEEKKREARKERRIVEQLVDGQLQLEMNQHLPLSESQPNGFRYRATSPQSFGLTARDILMADDSHLNEFAGLKKLAAFRDPTKKQKDKKHLGKKARLRKWRRDVFGEESGLQEKELVPSSSVPATAVDADDGEGGVDVAAGGRKKRRRKNKKLRTEVD